MGIYENIIEARKKRNEMNPVEKKENIMKMNMVEKLQSLIKYINELERDRDNPTLSRAERQTKLLMLKELERQIAEIQPLR